MNRSNRSPGKELHHLPLILPISLLVYKIVTKLKHVLLCYLKLTLLNQVYVVLIIFPNFRGKVINQLV